MASVDRRELTRFAGTASKGYTGDGGPATLAPIGPLRGIAIDTDGNIFIAQQSAIRKVSRDGTIRTIAGTARSIYTGDGGPAISSQFGGITNLTIDASNNLYVIDSRHVRKIGSDGLINSVAGGGPTSGDPGDGGPAPKATLRNLAGLFVAGNGEMYLAEVERIRKVSSDQIINTIAGQGPAYTGDGGRAIDSRLAGPSGLTIGPLGNLLVADNFSRIRKVSTSGVISTVAGGTVMGHTGDGGPAISALLQALPPTGMANRYLSGDQRTETPRRPLSEK